MSLVNIARKLIPDGMLKTRLKEAYHLGRMIKHGCSQGYDIEYCFNDKTTRFTFHRDALEGISILFPDTSFRWISSVPVELAGYFSLGKIAEDSIVVDAGAFPGDFTIAAARMVPCGKVFALEPDPKNREYLKKVVEMNDLFGRVEVLPYALSDSNSTANLAMLGTGSQIYSSETITGSMPYFTQSVNVETRSLDTLLKEEGALENGRKIFIKMDIEGHELKAFAGARNTMKHGARFAIASYHVVDGQKTAIPLAEMFEDRGYEARQEYPPHLTLFAEPRIR